MSRKCLLLWASVVLGVSVVAQERCVDPCLDKEVKMIPLTRDTCWSSSYMWYPGQLAAYLQQWCLKKSKARCVNVGYPGKFFAPVRQAFFRKEVKLRDSLAVKWVGSGTISLSVNGRPQHLSSSSVVLPPGRSDLMFEVKTSDGLPCIMLSGNKDIENIYSWQVSFDRENWTIPEGDERYNTPVCKPDEVREQGVVIKPWQIHPLRNAGCEGTDGMTIRRNGYVLVDFYHLETGYLSFHAKGRGRLQVRVGETPEEAMNTHERWFEQKPLPWYELSENGNTISLPERALRYAVLECDGNVEIDSIRFDAQLWPVDYQMEFKSDDAYINRLFEMSRATLHTSMHGFYLDGVKRDFLPWAMDAIVSTLAGDYLFGDSQVSKNGISVALMPWNPKVSDLGVTDYPLHALIGLYFHYQRYGELITSLQYKDRVEQLMDFYTSIANENGFIPGNKGTAGYIPGWSVKNGPAARGIASYPQIMLYLNYKIAAHFSERWKDKKRAKAFRKQAERLKENIFLHFWDEERGAFVNGTDNKGNPDRRISHHAQYWAVLAGIFPENRLENLFTQVLPGLPYYDEDISYEKGYEMLAYARSGYVKEMWDYLYRVFGDWMNQGHTRFAENFSPKASRGNQLKFYGRDYGLSLCHGANGVPVVVGVLNGFLGFSPSDENSNEYVFRPQLLHLKWADARIPVKEGFISIRVRKEGDSEIEIPSGCTVKMVSAGKTKKWNESGMYKFRYDE